MLRHTQRWFSAEHTRTRTASSTGVRFERNDPRRA